MSINEEVQSALRELELAFPDTTVTFDPTGDGGAWVRMEPVAMGPAFVQQTSWIVFHLPYSYPEADVYPHFVRPDLSRRDGASLGEGLATSVACWNNGSLIATQISRRSNTFDSSANDVVNKLVKVLTWMAER